MDIDYDKIEHYLAFCSIGAGSSWGSAKTCMEALEFCKRALKEDWHASGKGYIAVYDITPVKRWWATTGERLKGESEKDGSTIEVPYLFSVSMDLPAPKKYKGRTLGGKRK